MISSQILRTKRQNPTDATGGRHRHGLRTALDARQGGHERPSGRQVLGAAGTGRHGRCFRAGDGDEVVIVLAGSRPVGGGGVTGRLPFHSVMPEKRLNRLRPSGTGVWRSLSLLMRDH